MLKKLGAHPWRTRVDGPRPACPRLHGPQKASTFGVWVFEFQAQRNPLPKVLVHAATYALRSKPRSRKRKNNDQRNALCTSCTAQPQTITNSDKRVTSVGKPGNRPSWHGASAACRCAPRLTAQTDRTCTIPLRTQLGPTVAQSSNLS